MYFPIRRSRQARPESDNIFWTASTTLTCRLRQLSGIVYRPRIEIVRINISPKFGKVMILGNSLIRNMSKTNDAIKKTKQTKSV